MNGVWKYSIVLIIYLFINCLILVLHFYIHTNIYKVRFRGDVLYEVKIYYIHDILYIMLYSINIHILYAVYLVCISILVGLYKLDK